MITAYVLGHNAENPYPIGMPADADVAVMDIARTAFKQYLADLNVNNEGEDEVWVDSAIIAIDGLDGEETRYMELHAAMEVVVVGGRQLDYDEVCDRVESWADDEEDDDDDDDDDDDGDDDWGDGEEI